MFPNIVCDDGGPTPFSEGHKLFLWKEDISGQEELTTIHLHYFFDD